jgi:sortase A
LSTLFKFIPRSKKALCVAAGILIVGLILPLIYLTSANRKEPMKQTPEVSSEPAISPEVKPVAATPGLPVRLIIPKLTIDAKVLYMGLTPEGDMAVPENNFKDVGWYQYGARPGNVGTAVIAGHVNGKKERGVFLDLHKIAAGDVVQVMDDKNKLVSFVVREIRNYDQNDQPEEVFNSSQGSHLNLITCAGEWNAAEHRYPDRLVAFADKVEGP